MKLSYFVNGFSGVTSIDDHPYMAADGFFFDDGKLDLDFYLKGMTDILFVGKLQMKYSSLMLDKGKSKKVVSVKNKLGFVSSFINEAEIPFINKLYPFVCKLLVNYESTYVSLRNGKRVKPAVDGATSYVDEECILTERLGFLYCSNWDGELLWQRNFSGAQGRYSPNLLFEHINHGILINMGELNDGSGAIVLLEKMTGNVIWEKLFPTRIEDYYLINQKIYCCVGNRMMIMNLQGEIEREFLADTEDQQYLSFWTDEKLLYVFTVESNQIIVYSMEGQLIRHYQLPEGHNLWHASKVRRFGDTNYLVISSCHLIGVEDGLLTWTPEEILAGKELELEERPAIIIQSIKEEDKMESYHVHIPCTDIRELLLHTEIELRRLLSMRAKGYYIDNKETRNRKFNGKVQLFINPAIEEKYRPHLDMLVRRCQYFAEFSFMKSGNGKKEIEISWGFSS